MNREYVIGSAASRRYRAGRRAAAVNARTVQKFSFPILLGNDTGHWRGSNDLLKIAVRNWLRALPANVKKKFTNTPCFFPGFGLYYRGVSTQVF